MDLPAVDPGHLDDLAADLLRLREQVLELAGSVRAAPPGADWTGPGADAARAAARRDAEDLVRAADDAGAAALLLRAHAEEVRGAAARGAAAAAAARVALDPVRGLGGAP
ncbi:hypothetical protein [Vallicoccus soli]|uniref:hypothetical protein n=1 Tax=Vallicoccus soli TaxID=2339232 RepID=UPI001059BAE1|nr:hypothetical protein [Vallicoccus soli]